MAFEMSGPAAGDWGGTAGAAAFGSQAVVLNEISVAADQSLAALRAARVFPRSDSAGQISGVDVAQAGLAGDFGGTE